MAEVQNMQKIVDKLNEWSYNYYVLDNPTVSDFEYDKLYEKLVELEKETNLILPDSPTQRVGDVVLSKFEKHRHINRLYSMNKSQDYEGIYEFDRKNKKELGVSQLDYVVELKFDGLTISLTYENKILKSAATRGNGIIGENVTEQVKKIKSIPLSIKNSETFEIQGEALMLIDEFEKYNKNHPEEQLKNVRNAAAGAIRSLDTKIIKERNLTAYFYNIGYFENEKFKTDVEVKNFLEDNKFNVSHYYFLCSNIEEAIEKVEYIGKIRETLNFQIDGAVIKINRFDYREKLGYTNKFPRWAIAYKFEAEEGYTKLLDVNWNVGRSSKVTPSAILEPIEIGGATVSRATLNNYDFIKSKNIRYNSEVLVRRSNDVIPEIVKAVNDYSDTKEILKPEVCPSCGSKLEEIGAHLFCTNTMSCKAQLEARLTHFVSRDAMNIEGLSEKTIQKLISIHNISDISDFYTLSSDDLSQIDGFKEKRINNTLNAIENSKKVNFGNFIYALGIPNVGIKTAYDISNKYNNIDDLFKTNIDELMNIPDIGDKTAESIYSFFQNEKNISVIKKLFELGINIKYNNSVDIDRQKLKDFTIVITGSFENYSRKELEKIIADNGGKATSSVSKNTNYLLLGENPGSKYDKAIKLGVTIISLEDLLDMIGDKN